MSASISVSYPRFCLVFLLILILLTILSNVVFAQDSLDVIASGKIYENWAPRKNAVQIDDVILIPTAYGIKRFDVSNLPDISELVDDSVLNDVTCDYLFVEGDWLIVVCNHNRYWRGYLETISIYDLEDVNNPTLIGEVTEEDLGSLQCSSIIYENYQLHLINSTSNWKIIDISDPQNIHTVSEYELVDAHFDDAEIYDEYLFGISSSSGLVVYNYFDLSSITQESIYFEDVEDISSIAIYDSHIFTLNDSTLSIFNLADNPLNPVEISSTGLLNLDFGDIIDVVKLGDLYIVAIENNGLFVFDFTDISNIQFIAEHELSDIYKIFQLEDPEYIFTFDEMRALQALNIADIGENEPDTVFEHFSERWTRSIALKWPYAYTGSEEGFTVIDISDVESPQEINFVTTDEIILNLQVQGNYLLAQEYYTHSPAVNTRIYDITDPTTPEYLTSVTPAGTDMLNIPILINGMYMYVAESDTIEFCNQLKVYDISALNATGEIFQLSSVDSVSQLAGYFQLLDENTLLVGKNYPASGFQIISLADIFNPEIIFTEMLPSGYNHSEAMYYYDSKFYIVTLTRQLYIYDLSEPSNPICTDFIHFNQLSSSWVERLFCHDPYFITQVYYSPIHLLRIDEDGEETEISIAETFSYARDLDVVNEGMGWVDYESAYFAQFDVVGIEDNGPPNILDYGLKEAYPNPFNPSITIPFTLPEQSKIKLKIFNIAGQEVTELINQPLESGIHEVVWNGQDSGGNQVSSGVYFVKLETTGFTHTKRIIMLK